MPGIKKIKAIIIKR